VAHADDPVVWLQRLRGAIVEPQDLVAADEYGPRATRIAVLATIAFGLFLLAAYWFSFLVATAIFIPAYMFAAGLLGRGAPVPPLALQEEFQRYDAPIYGSATNNMIGHTLARMGSEELIRDVLPRALRGVMAKVPAAQRVVRNGLYWLLESRAIGFNGHPAVMKAGEAICKRHLANAIADPELRAKLTPDYRMGCKRVLQANDYYPALARHNVDVVTDGIAEVREHSVGGAGGGGRAGGGGGGRGGGGGGF
jgi:uncharacterized membrane protein YgcG